MRISDWSSDVCSSDLKAVLARDCRKHALACDRLPEQARIVAEEAIEADVDAAFNQRLDLFLAGHGVQRAFHIGKFLAARQTDSRDQVENRGSEHANVHAAALALANRISTVSGLPEESHKITTRT